MFTDPDPRVQAVIAACSAPEQPSFDDLVALLVRAAEPIPAAG